MNLGGGNAAASSSRTRTPFHRAVTAAIAVPPSAAGNFEYHLLILALATFPITSRSICGTLGNSSAGTTQSIVAGPSALSAWLMASRNSPGFSP
jgi:hypothetical protein